MIVLDGRKQDIWSLAFSPDGTQLAVAGSASTVQLWDLQTRKARPLLGPKGPHRVVLFRDADRLLSVQPYGVRECHLTRKSPREWLGESWNFIGATLTADGAGLILVGQKNYMGQVMRLELDTLTSGWHQPHPRIPHVAELLPDSHLVIAGSQQIDVRDPLTGEAAEHSFSHADGVPKVSVHPAGNRLAVTAGTVLALLGLPEGVTHRLRNEGRKHFTDVAYHPTGTSLLVSCNDATVRVYDEHLKEQAAFDWELGPIRRVGFSPDGMRAVAAGKTGRLVVWDVDW